MIKPESTSFSNERGINYSVLSTASECNKRDAVSRETNTQSYPEVDRSQMHHRHRLTRTEEPLFPLNFQLKQQNSKLKPQRAATGPQRKMIGSYTHSY